MKHYPKRDIVTRDVTKQYHGGGDTKSDIIPNIINVEEIVSKIQFEQLHSGVTKNASRNSVEI